MNSAPGSFAARLGWTRAVATGTGAPARDSGFCRPRGAGAKAAAVDIVTARMRRRGIIALTVFLIR